MAGAKDRDQLFFRCAWLKPRNGRGYILRMLDGEGEGGVNIREGKGGRCNGDKRKETHVCQQVEQ